MNSFNYFKEMLAAQWLSQVPAFSPDLKDTGARYQGNPVFSLTARTPTVVFHLRVYRYTPLNSERSVLAFLPETEGSEDDDSTCPTCGEDGGTTCGAQNCGY